MIIHLSEMRILTMNLRTCTAIPLPACSFTSAHRPNTCDDVAQATVNANRLSSVYAWAANGIWTRLSNACAWAENVIESA